MAKNTRNKKPPAKLDPAKGSTSPSKTTEKEVNNEEVKIVIYSQFCVQRPPLGPLNSGRFWQVVVVQRSLV